MPWLQVKSALGLAHGGAIRTAIDAVLSLLGTFRKGPAQERVAFTIAFVALAAKMAKADGCVVPVEAETFHRLYEVHRSEEANVRYLFDLAAQDVTGYEHYARQIARALKDEPRILRDVLDALFHIAAADGIIHVGEDQFLRTVAGIFGIGATEFRSIRRAFTGETGGRGDDPYEVLGIDPDVSDSALKTHHRALVRDHHPDSLISRGIPEAFHDAAGRKLAIINAAYDRILRERGLKVAPAESGA